MAPRWPKGGAARVAPPENWVGSSSAPAWHPSRGSDAAHVRQVKQRHPTCAAPIGPIHSLPPLPRRPSNAPPWGPGVLAEAHGAGAAAVAYAVPRPPAVTEPRPPSSTLRVPRGQCSSRSSQRGVELCRPPCAPRGQCSSRSSPRGVGLSTLFDPPQVAAIPVFKPVSGAGGRFPLGSKETRAGWYLPRTRPPGGPTRHDPVCAGLAPIPARLTSRAPRSRP